MGVSLFQNLPSICLKACNRKPKVPAYYFVTQRQLHEAERLFATLSFLLRFVVVKWSAILLSGRSEDRFPARRQAIGLLTEDLRGFP